MNATFLKNICVMQEHGIKLCSNPVWKDIPNSVELESYTDAGEDMIVCLEEPTRKCLEEFCDNFDINERVMLWWSDGEDAAHDKGVPFGNIKDHYEDYEKWIKRLREIARLLQ